MSIGERLKLWRKGQNLTLKNISNTTGLSNGGLSENERNIKTISIPALLKIKEHYNIDLNYILTGVRKSVDTYDDKIYELLNDLSHDEKVMMYAYILEKKDFIKALQKEFKEI